MKFWVYPCLQTVFLELTREIPSMWNYEDEIKKLWVPFQIQDINVHDLWHMASYLTLNSFPVVRRLQEAARRDAYREQYILAKPIHNRYLISTL